MNTAPTLLVYGAGVHQVPILAAGRRRGYRIVAVDRDPRAPGVGLADRFLCTSLRDHDAIAAAIEDESICGVVARVTDPVALESSRRIAQGHGLAAPGPDLVAAATRKQAAGALCRTAGIRTPSRRTREDVVEALSAAGAAPPPRFCVRPDVTIRGKAAIRRVADVGGFEEALREAAAASANGAVDVSDWVEGIDVSVLAGLDCGRGRRIALWDEWVGLESSGRIVGIGAGMPSIIEPQPAAVDEAITALARACPTSRGLVTLSFRIDRAGRAHLIEIHLGIGGDALADLLLPAALPGFDVFDAMIAVQAGQPVEPPGLAPRARGLIRAEGSWRLIEAPEGRTLRARVRATLSEALEVPAALLDPAPF
ncbi:MAG: hypothetical protein U0900_06750 [Myxococcota bacterium]